jgi:hypothetical protein
MKKKTCKDCKYWGGFSDKIKGAYFCKKHKCYFLGIEVVCESYIKTKGQETIDFMLNYLPDVKKIIHNYPATVLVFKDGSKSVVKCEQKHDLEKAILYSWVKHHKKSEETEVYSDTVDLLTLGVVVTEWVNFDNMRGKWYCIGYKCGS